MAGEAKDWTGLDSSANEMVAWCLTFEVQQLLQQHVVFILRGGSSDENGGVGYGEIIGWLGWARNSLQIRRGLPECMVTPSKSAIHPSTPFNFKEHGTRLFHGRRQGTDKMRSDRSNSLFDSSDCITVLLERWTLVWADPCIVLAHSDLAFIVL